MERGISRSSGVSRLVAIAVLAALYIAISGIGLQLTLRYGPSVLLWSVNAISLAALILGGPRLWPAILIGEFSVALYQGLSPPVALGVSVGFTIEALVGSVVLVRHLDLHPSLDRVRDVVALLGVGGGLASLIGAVVGVTSIWLAGDVPGDEFVSRVLIWWRAGFGRIVTLTPFLLLARAGSPAWSELLRRMEFWLVVSLLLVGSVFAFGNGTIREFQTLSTHVPLLLVIWAGARLGTRGASVVTFLTLIFVAAASRRGVGPFVADDLATTVSLVFIYNMGIGSMGPLIAAAIAQRDCAEAESTREAAERLRLARGRALLQQRERIMREMHDGLGGQLISVLSMVQRGNATRQEIAEGLRRALDDMRIMIDSLEPSREGLRGLLGKLRARLEPLLRRNGLEFVFRIDPGAPLDALDAEQSLHCVRIIQEAVANVIQHARAGRIGIVVASDPRDASRISIEVSDDGIGGGLVATQQGHGMGNMSERAREVGGEIRFESTDPGHRVWLTFPVAGQLRSSTFTRPTLNAS